MVLEEVVAAAGAILYELVPSTRHQSGLRAEAAFPSATPVGHCMFTSTKMGEQI